MKEVIFICPKCGGNELEEVLTDCIVYAQYPKIFIYGDGIEATLDRPDNSYKEDIWEAGDYSEITFQCRDCGFVLPVDEYKITEWLLKNGKTTERTKQ